MPNERLIRDICKILKQEGFIRNYVIAPHEKDKIKISLKYKMNVNQSIRSIKQVSKPSVRKYFKYKSKLNILNRIGVNVFAACFILGLILVKFLLTGIELRLANKIFVSSF